MPLAYTAYAKQQQHLLSPTDVWVVLLEINHPAAPTEPIRFVVDPQPLTSNGNEYMPIAARLEFPDDVDGTRPSARVSIDNVGRSLMRIIEDTHGMRGATVTLSQIYRSRPDVVEQSITLDVQEINVTQTVFSMTLAFEAQMDAPSVPLTYRPSTKPSLF